MTDSTMIEVSSGNVFTDLAIPNPNQYLAKAKLASRIIELIQQQTIPLTETLTLLSLNQDQLEQLMKGQLDEFSSEHLFQLLNALDQDIEILIHPQTSPNNKATIKVTVRDG